MYVPSVPGYEHAERHQYGQRDTDGDDCEEPLQYKRRSKKTKGW